ncbi:hypothetical protein KM043_014657 [Ampulex compressa]|nr:hypothetical protein KM043_014657 [Ampulex compressa]
MGEEKGEREEREGGGAMEEARMGKMKYNGEYVRRGGNGYLANEEEKLEECSFRLQPDRGTCTHQPDKGTCASAVDYYCQPLKGAHIAAGMQEALYSDRDRRRR